MSPTTAWRRWNGEKSFSAGGDVKWEAAGGIEDMFDHPQVLAAGLVARHEHPVLGTVRQVASPLRMSDAVLPNERAPQRGEHTEAVLRELCGYDDEAIARLEGEKR